MCQPAGLGHAHQRRIAGYHTNLLDGYNNLPASGQTAVPECHSTDSKPKGEFSAAGDPKPTRYNGFSLRYLLVVSRAYLGRILAYSKIEQNADADLAAQIDAQTSLKRVLDLDAIVSQGTATSQDDITKPSLNLDGLGNKGQGAALKMYECSESRRHKALLLIALPKIRPCLGMITLFFYSHGCRPVFAAPVGHLDVGVAIEQPQVYSWMVIGLFAINFLFAVAVATSWVRSGSEITGGKALLLATFTIVLSILTMIVLSDTKQYPTLSVFLMVPSSFAQYAAMVYNFHRKLGYSRRYIRVCLFVTLLLLGIVVTALTIQGTQFLDSMAAVPIVLPSCAWMVYAFFSL
ncbi:hypothetical protein D6C91_09791 [Aureobasidium pullulans]|uniref:Uncharacterized protein n=1 Tax=Aureobasidium pullulans TaxID=5580 RepID=A0A4S9SFX1_AURPU|nr:hypothetical protein D6C91_09791 [Aureobasidium pullulans]